MRCGELGRLGAPVGSYGKHARPQTGTGGGVDPQPYAAFLPYDLVEEGLGHSGFAAAAHSVENMDPPVFVPDRFRQPAHQVGTVSENPRGPPHERSAHGIG